MVEYLSVNKAYRTTGTQNSHFYCSWSHICKNAKALYYLQIHIDPLFPCHHPLICYWFIFSLIFCSVQFFIWSAFLRMPALHSKINHICDILRHVNKLFSPLNSSLWEQFWSSPALILQTCLIWYAKLRWEWTSWYPLIDAFNFIGVKICWD